MNNQFKKKVEEPEEEQGRLEQEEEPRLSEEPPKESSTLAFFRKLFTEGVVSKEAATDMLPFLIFLCVLVMVYIANSHMAVKNVRNIDKLSKEVKELSWEYKSLKADLMFKSKLTEVAKKVDTLGIKELIEPPKKIIINDNEH
ncbi:FtsL-like putative cell division protein [Pedobacter sp. KR3-3]|uniref:FtsL-like putative cell division protein n=1 Tax=Pedobacter albus TaxID=3113905 RepID=A0ABU7I6K8_9SPHI|nr:FtsL-like putative cell division protein [Pedobacter sp. KR3-3]MEE1945110.1 FtsL-like putative cell division protein [Pedobacter sp. KR3-3]